GDAELPGGEHASMARNQATVLAHQGRRRPPPLPDARGYRGHLGVRVGAGVSGVQDQPINRPPLDLVGRPRSLIIGLDSRAGARAAREGKLETGAAVRDDTSPATRYDRRTAPSVGPSDD